MVGITVALVGLDLAHTTGKVYAVALSLVAPRSPALLLCVAASVWRVAVIGGCMEVAAAVDTHSIIIVVVTIVWLLHMVTWYDAHMQARTAA